jgi:hypothetical protein
MFKLSKSASLTSKSLVVYSSAVKLEFYKVGFGSYLVFSLKYEPIHGRTWSGSWRRSGVAWEHILFRWYHLHHGWTVTWIPIWLSLISGKGAAVMTIPTWRVTRWLQQSPSEASSVNLAGHWSKGQPVRICYIPAESSRILVHWIVIHFMTIPS